MNIALCGRFNTDLKHQGGSSEVMLVLARLLSKKHNVTLFGRGKPTRDIVKMCEQNNITYYYFPSDTIISILLGPFRATMLLHKHFNNFDIIHTHNGSYAIASVLFKKRCNIVTHVHEVVELGHNSFIETIYLSGECLLLRLAAKHSNLTLTVSEYLRAILQDKWHIKYVEIMQNGTDVNLFKYRRKRAVDALFGDKNYKLLYVGRLVKRKGILELIEAIKYLKTKNLRLIIIGSGNLLPKINQQISKNDCISLIPYVEHSELSYFYSAANFVIIPSKYDPSPLVAKEALACGTPILVSNNTGLSELKNAFFIEGVSFESIAEAIIEVRKIKTPTREFYRRYIIKNYTWARSIITLESFYGKLLE
jgi:glycosyltransferase involved in cell wall biosynthesis